MLQPIVLLQKCFYAFFKAAILPIFILAFWLIEKLGLHFLVPLIVPKGIIIFLLSDF